MSAANCVDAQPIPIGERILGLLVQVGESAAWLAEKSGVERSTVSRAVKGERHPSLETLSAFAPVLGVTLDELVTGTTAAARVKDAQSLVSRDHYDAAVQQLVDYERKANEAVLRARDAELAAARDRERRLIAEGSLDSVRQEARRHEREAREYRDAFRRSLARIGQLETQIRELGAAIDESRQNGRIAAILAGAAACASVATFLWRSDTDTDVSAKNEQPQSVPRSGRATF